MKKTSKRLAAVAATHGIWADLYAVHIKVGPTLRDYIALVRENVKLDQEWAKQVLDAVYGEDRPNTTVGFSVQVLKRKKMNCRWLVPLDIKLESQSRMTSLLPEEGT